MLCTRSKQSSCEKHNYLEQCGCTEQELGAYAAAVALQDMLHTPADSLYARLARRVQQENFGAAGPDDTADSDSDEPDPAPGLSSWSASLLL